VIARRIAAYGAPLLAAVVVGSAIYLAPRYYNATATRAAVAPAAAAPAAPGRKIKARLFYVSEDGTRLTGIERDVAYSEGAADQAREIIAAQIGPVAEPLVSAIPPGTALRALFITGDGQAFVDLSREVVAAHPGGTSNELLTVYTIVNAVTANLPAVTSVQILVDGKEVETLAGHVDLRRPLAKNAAWVQ
jgi:spore germination protein GerM